MLGTRHEEYRRFGNGLPFVFNADIRRTASNRSTDSNWHENLEIQICTAGCGTVLLDGEKYAIEKDDIIVVNSNVLHHTGTDTSLTYSCLIVSTEFCKNIGIDPKDYTFSPFVKSQALADLFSQLETLYSAPHLPFRIAKLNDIVLRILIQLAENHLTKESPTNSNIRNFETVKAVICYIRENYREKITLDEISRAVLLNKYALCREFKRLTGQTIIENLNNYRCIKAIDLLSEGHSVADTALFCGFSNLSFFTKTFKKHIGKLPSEYKK